MFSGVWPLPEPLPCHAPPCPHRYEDGKYLNKKNTFLDFVACAGVGVCVEGGGQVVLCAGGCGSELVSLGRRGRGTRAGERGCGGQGKLPCAFWHL